MNDKEDKLRQYKAWAMYKRLRWDDWIDANLERLPTNKKGAWYDNVKASWYEGFNLGERSLDDKKN